MTVSVSAAGRLTDRIGARWPMAAGMVLLGVSLLLLSRLRLDSTLSDLVPGLVTGGIGVGITLAPGSLAQISDGERRKTKALRRELTVLGDVRGHSKFGTGARTGARPLGRRRKQLG
jgi:MFS family permease